MKRIISSSGYVYESQDMRKRAKYHEASREDFADVNSSSVTKLDLGTAYLNITSSAKPPSLLHNPVMNPGESLGVPRQTTYSTTELRPSGLALPEKHPSTPNTTTPNNSYQSLLLLAQGAFKDISSRSAAQVLIQDIKRNYRENGKRWTPEALGYQKLLEDMVEKFAYMRYSHDKPADVSGLNENEQREFVDYIKALATSAENVDILVQGSEAVALSSQSDSVLQRAVAFRVLPKDFAQRHAARAKVGARLTININKAHFNQLAKALTQLFSDDNRGWLHQAKIMGPKNLGSRTDQAVIYLSSAGVEHAQEIHKKLSELLAEPAFLEHTPSGMYRVGKGIAYSETAEGDSSSHGQSRAKLIAAAVAQSLLTDTPIERTLPRVLQARGYNVLNPALLTQRY